MSTPADLLTRLWALLDDQAWDDLAPLFEPDVRIEYLHSRETLDLDAFVLLNREYPGRWRCTVDDAVTAGDRAVVRVRVEGGETYWVASFGTVRDGRITALTEVWSPAVADPPADRRPDQT